MSKKIGNSPKGLTHDFGQKLELPSLFVFIENRSGNDVWDVLHRKQAFLDNKNMYLMSEKSEIFQRG